MSTLVIGTRISVANPAVAVVDMDGLLDFNTAGDFETTLLEFFKNRQYKIILNLEKLTYISSAGVGLLVGNIKEIRKKGGDIKLVAMSPEIYKVFDLLELSKLFHQFKTEQEAISQF